MSDLISRLTKRLAEQSIFSNDPLLTKLLAVVAAAEQLCACTYRRVTDNTDFALKTIIDEQCDNCKALDDLRRECE